MPTNKSNIEKTNNNPATKCPRIILPREIGFERIKSTYPSFSIEGINEETRIMNNVKNINPGMPDTISSSSPSRASSNFVCPDIASNAFTPSIESILIKYRMRKIIKEKKTMIDKIIFLARASLKIPHIKAKNISPFPFFVLK
jgi:hypothetical protein